MWLEDVKAGKITDKDGTAWPVDKITMSDFYNYLSGEDGKDGQSAYELWKTTAAAGQLDNPQKPGEKWPANEVSELDFYRFLAGKDGEDGKDGTDGLSAYQLWKEDLAKRCGTDNPILDHKTGAKWDCEKIPWMIFTVTCVEKMVKTVRTEQTANPENRENLVRK
ncbi:hypothetical protein [uncultured Bacteroides sp.]|uniref:hypothetical protein n=1 Tax=uncultured Bacteroides sp. TaxID=162156 RepID=UPI00266F3CBE|nr:hypothetical protein [uncultured Bacteroides sp.]